MTSGNGQFNSPTEIAFSGANLYVTDLRNDRVQELSPTGSYIRQFGIEGSNSGEFYGPIGIAADSAGNLYVTDNANDRVEEFSATGAFRASFGSKGSGEAQLSYPQGISINAAGDMYVVDTDDNRLEEWAPANQAAHDTKTTYYSTKGEAAIVGCQNHPEWANMPCQIEPAAQPETPGLPNLPIDTFTYNMYGQPLTSTNIVAANTRTVIDKYDEAGRTLTSEISSTTGKSLPQVNDKYSETTGALTEQSTTSEGTTETIKSTYNTLGQLTSYTDADGNTTKYEYEPEGDARLTNTEDGKGTQKYEYNETSGAIKKLVDTQGTNVLAFTATYDTEGNLISEGYPNGMSANYTLNQTGEATALNYVKTTHCTENCTWLTDTATPSIHGQWLSQQSTLGSESYIYDEDGRLTQTQETPAGEGCTTRIYTDDEETNMTGLITRPPGTGGACATEGGTTAHHIYDSANRLTDEGTSYDPFGDTTKLPAADAGGYELTSTFYADSQLEDQTQHGQSIGYQLDPDGRTRETVDTGTVNSTYVSHYTSPEGSPAWTIEPLSGHWTRYITAFTGLSAIETDTTSPTLQLSDLHGNIIATASTSETATKLLSTERTTEYGVPTNTTPAKYSWLGADQRPAELTSGIIAMGARSYIPQLGRYLQTDPIPGGSANQYVYVYGDPINTSDPSGAYTNGPSAWAIGLAGQLTAEEVAAYEAALRAEAEREAREAAEAAAAQDPTTPTEGAPEPLGGYEGWTCEYAAQTGQEAEGCEGDGDPVATIAVPCRKEDNPQASACNARGEAIVAKRVNEAACVVTMLGVKSTCAQVLERAKAEYGAGNHKACTQSVEAVGAVAGGGVAKGVVYSALATLLGIHVGATVASAVC
ncbi:MAG TPA: RHS repeat-associated core domain-containing protein [Solirubrobacteraceae bacterium]|nr:RHS repeat-associated core domain-containing protein [Solirubrobacteraceae bacterium]